MRTLTLGWVELEMQTGHRSRSLKYPVRSGMHFYGEERRRGCEVDRHAGTHRESAEGCEYVWFQLNALAENATKDNENAKTTITRFYCKEKHTDTYGELALMVHHKGYDKVKVMACIYNGMF